MSDRGIREHAFHTGLPDSDRIPDSHGDSCHERHECRPVEITYQLVLRRALGKYAVEKANHKRKARGFWPDRKKCGNDCGRSLKYVRQPEMKWNRSDLVSDSHQN